MKTSGSFAITVCPLLLTFPRLADLLDGACEFDERAYLRDLAALSASGKDGEARGEVLWEYIVTASAHRARTSK